MLKGLLKTVVQPWSPLKGILQVPRKAFLKDPLADPLKDSRMHSLTVPSISIFSKDKSFGIFFIYSIRLITVISTNGLFFPLLYSKSDEPCVE